MGRIVAAGAGKYNCSSGRNVLPYRFAKVQIKRMYCVFWADKMFARGNGTFYRIAVMTKPERCVLRRCNYLN